MFLSVHLSRRKGEDVVQCRERVETAGRRNARSGRDGMDTALPSGTLGPTDTLRPSRTDRHQCARVAFRHVHLRSGGPK